MCMVVASLIVQNYLDYILNSYSFIMMRKLVVIYGYAIRPVILVLFLHIVCPDRKFVGSWILAGVNAFMYLLTAFGIDLCFKINENNHWEGGMWLFGYTCTVVSFLLLVYLFYLSIREFRISRARDAWIPVFAVVLITVTVLLDFEVGYNTPAVNYLTDAIVTDCILYYNWLHMRFVKEYEEALRAQQRIEIMMSQMQPHFLYNTLMTIQALCRKDPEKAFEITGRFGIYLRQNIDSLEHMELVPLEKELEHTRIYSEIETVRFPRIRVEYDIRDNDVQIPVLTIQPLVENAIRHGVRVRENGIVTVASRRISGFHEIVISDNGKGFDVNKVMQTDREQTGNMNVQYNRQHIGIRNVRERIEKMCGGTLTVESRVGEGTVVTIRIPVDGGSFLDE